MYSIEEQSILHRWVLLKNTQYCIQYSITFDVCSILNVKYNSRRSKCASLVWRRFSTYWQLSTYWFTVELHTHATKTKFSLMKHLFLMKVLIIFILQNWKSRSGHKLHLFLVKVLTYFLSKPTRVYSNPRLNCLFCAVSIVSQVSMML